MPSVTVEIPERLAALMKGLPIEKMTYEAIVLDLYRRATISSGKAAELLGLPHVKFIKSSGKLGIPFIQMSPRRSAPEADGLMERVRALRESIFQRRGLLDSAAILRDVRERGE